MSMNARIAAMTAMTHSIISSRVHWPYLEGNSRFRRIRGRAGVNPK